MTCWNLCNIDSSLWW